MFAYGRYMTNLLQSYYIKKLIINLDCVYFFLLFFYVLHLIFFYVFQRSLTIRLSANLYLLVYFKNIFHVNFFFCCCVAVLYIWLQLYSYIFLLWLYTTIYITTFYNTLYIYMWYICLDLQGPCYIVNDKIRSMFYICNVSSM